jgi:hypothetical protein
VKSFRWSWSMCLTMFVSGQGEGGQSGTGSSASWSPEPAMAPSDEEGMGGGPGSQVMVATNFLCPAGGQGGPALGCRCWARAGCAAAAGTRRSCG